MPVRKSRPRSAPAIVLGVLGMLLLASCTGDSAGIPDGEPDLSVIDASFETLAGEDVRIPFGLVDSDNVPRTGADVEVYLRTLEGEVLSGPHEPEFHSTDDSGTPTGVYIASLPSADPGTHEVVVVDGDQWGAAAVQIVDAGDSQAPAPGDDAIAVQTPTFDDDLGIEQISTLSEPTTMHETSLDEVLEQGRPAMVLFATPAYCQTAVCGPAVESLEEVHLSRDWGDVEFLHLEIFTDGGQTVAPWVEEWNLPTEPWLFAVDSDGVIVDRMDGSLVRSEMEAMAERLAEGGPDEI